MHRIGRTGRAGKAGTALTIVMPLDKKHVAEIEKLIGRPIPWLDGTGFDSLLAPQDEAARPNTLPGTPARSARTAPSSQRPRRTQGIETPVTGRSARQTA